MKILSWNLHEDINCNDLLDVINALNLHEPEIIFLHQFVNDRNGQIICNAMNELGWQYQFFTGADRQKGIMILSTKDFTRNRCNYRSPSNSYGWLDILFQDFSANVMAINISYKERYINPEEYWEFLIDYSKIKMVDECIILGSLSPIVKNDKSSYYSIKEMLKTGWIDLIQSHQEESEINSTYLNNICQRQDYAFASRIAKSSIRNVYVSQSEKKMGFNRQPVILELV
ncbi:MAG TPA: hypothetical protein VFD00_09680 [Thermoclostridium sp.]|nr:hypothetical protein [Thermoclostridium sp.]